MACRAALPRVAFRAPISASSFPSQISRSAFAPRGVFRYRFLSEAKLGTVTRVKEDTCPSNTWKIKMLYDGDCPLCMREVNFLRERNRSYGAINFVDISSKDYSPEENQGLDYETVCHCYCLIFCLQNTVLHQYFLNNSKCLIMNTNDEKKLQLQVNLR
ncbi:hypothetical protein BHM03_00059368 [Ensete ventricosum]|uniref:Thiol-disulfide oxidoreductase DCC n=1 Tax=Ensete ventricosum TaxID=4639 RepID=A0A426Y2G6_ENSVE|nr:hypothetical protein B296_00027550 [Ensete ventricosum]RZS26072.1 hypothetical protein BHM03_00059368 [Ensete ventricosum]